MAWRWWRHALAMCAIVVALGATQIAFGERIGINNGQGWDGQAYTAWSLDFPGQVIEPGLTRYHAQRVLPSAIVYYVGHALGIAPRVMHHIVLFQWLDLALLAAAALLWAHLAFAVMRWRTTASWAGFAALFGCFANARHTLYYPTLTDPMAFALGMLLVWGYLARRGIAVWIACALATWTWPALPPNGFPMLLFPRPLELVPPVANARRVRWIAGALALAGTAFMFAVSRAYYLHPVPGIGCDKFAQWVHVDLLVVTVPLLAAMLIAAGYFLGAPPRLWNVVAYARALSWRRLVLAAVGCAAVFAARAWWQSAIATQGDGPTFGNQIMCENGNEMLRGPLWGPVHHVVYFGPIVLVAMFSWRRISELAASWGPACSLALMMILAFSAGSQSRQWIHLLPLLVALTIGATEELWTPRITAGFVVLVLAWSKLWFHIGYEQVHHWFDWPDQRYYMNLGPWASDTGYLVHLVAVAVTAVPIGWFALRRARDQQVLP